MHEVTDPVSLTQECYNNCRRYVANVLCNGSVQNGLRARALAARLGRVLLGLNKGPNGGGLVRTLGFVSKCYLPQILRSIRWMKAIRIMPPKLIAVFSKREKMRRLSFSQPIRRSMMLRSR